MHRGDAGSLPASDRDRKGRHGDGGDAGSVLGRTLATIRDDGAGDLRPAPPPRAATCVVPTRDGTFAQRLAAWAAQQAPGRVVFTVADANYASTWPTRGSTPPGRSGPIS